MVMGNGYGGWLNVLGRENSQLNAGVTDIKDTVLVS